MKEEWNNEFDVLGKLIGLRCKNLEVWIEFVEGVFNYLDLR